MKKDKELIQTTVKNPPLQHETIRLLAFYKRKPVCEMISEILAHGLKHYSPTLEKISKDEGFQERFIAQAGKYTKKNTDISFINGKIYHDGEELKY